MEIIVSEKSEIQREVEITANAAELQPHFEKAYVDYRPKVEIKGFRKGRVPLDMVKRLYGDLIENESLSQVATELYRQAVKEKELKPLGDPTLVDMSYKRGEKAWFKIQYDVRPTIALKDYAGIRVEKMIHTVDDKEIESEIVRLRRMNAVNEAAEAVTGDEFIVTADLQDLNQDGSPLVGKKAEDIRFYLADDQLEQPFKDALKSARVGSVHDVQFQHQHGEHTHDVRTQVTVKKVEKVTLPELNDEFVKKISKDKVTSVADFRKGLHDDLVAYWKQRTERQFINSLTAELIRMHDIKVPESLVRSVLEGLLEEMKNDYPKRQIPSDFDYEKFSEQNQAYAVYQAKWALLREELLKAEHIEATDADLERLALQEAEKINIDKDRLISYYKTSEQIKDRLVGEKLIKRLVEIATVVEVQEPH